MLQPLFVPVVAGCAKALPVALVPEQNHVALVRDDVIHDCGHSAAASVRADRVELQPFHTGFAPCAVIAALCCCRAVGVVALVPSAGAGDLTNAAGAMWHDLAAGADMGRAGHAARALE